MGLLKNFKAKRQEKKSQRAAKKAQRQELKKQKKEAKIAKRQAKANRINARAEAITTKANAKAAGTWQSGAADLANNAISAVKSVFVGEDTATPVEYQEQETTQQNNVVKYGFFGAIGLLIAGLIAFIVKKS